MYAYDNAGNLTNPGISFDFSSKGPSVDDFRVAELREGAFTVLAHVTSPNGVSSVRYAIWTDNNGQDDLRWYDAVCTDNNDYYWARINFSDHNGERGRYTVHIYTYDSAGQGGSQGISYVFDDKGPTISNITVSDISEAGYTVTCQVTDNIGVLRVQFPTWTTNNGQDDLADNWKTNKAVRGTISGDTVTFRVNASDHNGEQGTYRTHIYAYDTLGNVTSVAVPDVTVEFKGYESILPDGDYAIVMTENANASPFNYLDIQGAAVPAANGTNVVCTAGSGKPQNLPSCDIWTITYNNDGFYSIKQKDTNVSLDVADASTESGANVMAHASNGGTNQQWAISKNGAGYRIEARNSGYSLEIADGSTVTGTNIRVWNDNDSAAQRWSFIPVNRDISEAFISAIAEQTYTGSAVTPKPTVSWQGITLVEGTDYTLSYSNNVNAGTATVTATGKGSYTGSISRKFLIVAAQHAPGWANENGGWYYYNDDGSLRTDAFMLVEGKYYYLGKDGKMVTGGWVQHSGVSYYIDSDWSLALNRWVRYGGKWYYFGADAQIVANAWMQFEGSWYCFDKNGQIVVNTWFNNGNDWYYINASGQLVVDNWAQYQGVWCHFNASGVCDYVWTES